MEIGLRDSELHSKEMIELRFPGINRKLAYMLSVLMFLNALSSVVPLISKSSAGLVKAASTEAVPTVRLPLDGSSDNIGSSSVSPKVVGTLPGYVAGYASKALQFDTDYTKVNTNHPAPHLDLGNHSDLTFGKDTDFTIAFWLKFPNTWKTTGWPVLISNKKSNSAVGWRITTDTYENIRWQMTVEGQPPFPEVYVHRIVDTKWHHFAVTHDRDGFARFYIDGAEVAGKAVDLSGKTGTVDTALSPKIGVNGDGLLANQTADKLNIHLDDLRIYRRALPAEDVLGLTQNVTNLIMMEHIQEMAVGESATPVTYVMYQDKRLDDAVSGIRYESSNPSVATISSEGELRALAAGETIVTASYDGFEDSFTLSVHPEVTPPAWRTQLREEHPRLLATAQDFEALREKVVIDPQVAAWFENIKQQGEALLSNPVYNGNDPQRILLLGTLYHVTQESAYSERAWLEIEHLLGQAAWDPDMFLEHSARLMSASFAYDWFYHAWSEERLERLREQIIEKGLLPGILTYRLGANAPYNTNYWNGAVNPYPSANNWNTVGNAGQLIGALAIGDESLHFADEIIESGMTDILESLKHFSPHGGWYEGYAYWNYTWIYLSRLLASIDSALGEANNPLISYPGLSESGYFPLYLTGSTNMAFDFGDSGTGIGDNEQLYYLANRYHKPEFTQYQIPFTNKVSAIDPLTLLWYNPQHAKGSEYASLPLEKEYSGIEIGSMRQSWADPDGVSVTFKAGAAQNGHMDLDAGSFVLDALGERWFMDLGDRNRYEWPNFFSTWGPRWTYYTKRAEGHNTLVLNPKPATGVAGDPDQTYIYGADYGQFMTTIEAFHASGNRPFSIMDLTKAYANQDAISVRRGIALLNQRQHVLLQDEVKFNNPGEVYSFLHFNGKAEATVADDGKSALLTIEDKRLWIGLIGAEANDTLEILDALPLPSSPNPSVQYTKPGNITPETPKKKLAVHLTNRQTSTIALYIVPLEAGGAPPSGHEWPEVTPLSAWSTVFADDLQPVTTANAPSGWINTPVTVELTATDTGSGVRKTMYSLDNGAFTEGNTVEVAEDGIHHIRYYSVDYSGNTEEMKTATVKIDTVGPAVASTVTLDVYWTDSGNLQFAISDSLSGVNSIRVELDGEPIDHPYAFEPTSLVVGDHSVIVKAIDSAGNETVAENILKIRMDNGRLDEAIQYARQQQWIDNEGIVNSLLSKIEKIQLRADVKQATDELKSLENFLHAQSGKMIDAEFVASLLHAMESFK